MTTTNNGPLLSNTFRALTSAISFHIVRLARVHNVIPFTLWGHYEAVTHGIVASLEREGFVALSAAWFLELNTRTGANAIFCETCDADTLVGSRADHVAAYDALAEWSYNVLEANRLAA